jgi:hypothetical protein
LSKIVIPAHAGTQTKQKLGSRLRGNDENGFSGR